MVYVNHGHRNSFITNEWFNGKVVGISVSCFLLGLRAIDCESLSGGRFRLIFESKMPVTIELTDGTELKTDALSPAEVQVPAGVVRPIFRLRSGTEVRSIAERRLPLKGTPNFRDLGGYETNDGRHVVWGKLFRSGTLAKLTSEDYDYLGHIGIRMLCDFRSPDERKAEPTQWMGPSPEMKSYPIGGTKSGTLDLKAFGELIRSKPDPLRVKKTLEQFYEKAPIDSAPQYRAAMESVMKSEGPAMWHCSAGKDRTGVFSAIFLTILGVKREIVEADYVLTDKYFFNEKQLPTMAAGMKTLMRLDFDVDPQVLKPAMRAEPEYIQAAFRAIGKKYGSFDVYRREALGVSDSDVRKLQARYLEN